jgi:serine/threonine-protein kinase
VTDVPNVVDRFKVEAQSAASIRHPHIVEVTDFGLTPDRRPFFVMELLEGESLATRLATRRSLPERDVVEIVDQILSGLSLAHDRGVIHRDLKPENVFLARYPKGGEAVKILDFGIAKILGSPAAADTLASGGSPAQPRLSLGPDGRSLTMQGMVLGTPGYLAPETAANKSKADARSDLFAVGVLMYEMLTGVLPFRGETVNAVLVATMQAPVPRISEIASNVSRAMEQVVYTALAKMPEQRYQNTREFVRHLTAAAVGRIPDDARPCVTEIADVWPPVAVTKGHQDSIDTVDGPAVKLAIELPAFVAERPKLPSYVLERAATKRAERADEPARPPGAHGRIARLAVAAIILAMVIGLAVGLAVLLSRPSEDDIDPVTMQAKVPRTVTVWLQVKPKGALVEWNGARIDSRPISLPESGLVGTLTVSAPGYRPQRFDLVPDRERSLKVTLVAERSPPPPGSAPEADPPPAPRP